jgi:hypothetical protein
MEAALPPIPPPLPPPPLLVVAPVEVSSEVVEALLVLVKEAVVWPQETKDKGRVRHKHIKSILFFIISLLKATL